MPIQCSTLAPSVADNQGAPNQACLNEPPTVAGAASTPFRIKAAGGASIVHLDAKLTAHEAVNGPADGATAILALTTETALFVAGSYAENSPRLASLTWGAEDRSDKLGPEANRDSNGSFLYPYRLARPLFLAGAAGVQV